MYRIASRAALGRSHSVAEVAGEIFNHSTSFRNRADSSLGGSMLSNGLSAPIGMGSGGGIAGLNSSRLSSRGLSNASMS